MKKGLLSDFVRKKRLQTSFPYLQGDVLDIGCGYSEIIDLLQPSSNYVGIDENPKALKRMQRRYPSKNFIVADIDNQPLPIRNASFDTVVMLAIVEHLKRPEYVLKQLSGFMKEGAILIITSPTKVGDWMHRSGAKLGLFSSQAVQEHERIFSRRNLFQLLHENGLKVVDYKTFLFGLNQILIGKKSTDSIRNPEIFKETTD